MKPEFSNLRTNPAVADDQLWKMSLAGDREAFGRIVERYQALICSLAYSACGSLSRSEDLAQETFVTAWQRLSELRDPSRLRAWLCGIVRRLSANALRREQRRGGPAESLEMVAEPEAAEEDPAAQVVTQEEETLLWRTLSQLPENYREPMVLFYRQGQSISEVATSLELSEEAVRQRLSRGRTMMREGLATVVESTLTRTRPGAAFKIGVLVALPMASASAAGAVAGGGTASLSAGKGILAKLGLGPFIGPVIGLFFAYLGTRAAASTARSPAERATLLRYSRWIIAFCLAMSLGLAGVLSQAGKLYVASAVWIVVGVGAWTAILVGGILAICHRLDRQVRAIREATSTTDEAYARTLAAEGRKLKSPKYFESQTRLLGLPLFAAAWGGASSDSYRARTVCGWLAIGDIAMSPLLAVGGVAIAPIALGAISVGVLSLSIFWGVAFGVLAVGSLACGWWALGCAAAGVKCAVGFAAVARDYAFGMVAKGSETGLVAKEWIRTEWWQDFTEVILGQSLLWILTCVLMALVMRLWKGLQGKKATDNRIPK